MFSVTSSRGTDMAAAMDATKNTGSTTEAGHRRIRPDHEFPLRRVTEATCLLALLLSADVATAQNIRRQAALRVATTEAPARVAAELPAPTALAPPALAPPTKEKLPAGPPKISYVSGQLKIDAFDSTLADVLTRVAALTGVSIEVPAGARTERMPVVELGPGTARQVLASLLSDSTFDYLIQSSSTDPEKLQSVLLIPREKKNGGANVMEATARRGTYGRVLPETAAPDNPAPAQPEAAAAESSALNSAPAPVQADPSATSVPVQPDQSAMLPSAQQDPSALARPGAMAPPQTLTPQSINQQLQQMYQQRIQM